MGHHHQKEQVVDILFNLRKMEDGYQLETIEEDVYKIKTFEVMWWSKDCQMTQLPAENGELLF